MHVCLTWISLLTLHVFIVPEFRKSCGDELESDNSAVSEGDKENKVALQQRSKSLEGLADDKENKAFLQQVS